ncbi:MAG: hypothetical protein ACOYVK_11100 [Bacillota bacterium]
MVMGMGIGIVLYLFGLIVTFIIAYILIKSAVKGAILEAKEEIMQDLRLSITGAIVQAEKDLSKTRAGCDSNSNSIIDKRL